MPELEMPADKASLTLATGRGSVPKESTPVTNSGKRRPGQRCGVVWKLLGHVDRRTHRSVLANSARAEWARRPIQSDSAGSGSTAGQRPRGKGDGVPPTPHGSHPLPSRYRLSKTLVLPGLRWRLAHTRRTRMGRSQCHTHAGLTA